MNKAFILTKQFEQFAISGTKDDLDHKLDDWKSDGVVDFVDGGGARLLIPFDNILRVTRSV